MMRREINTKQLNVMTVLYHHSSIKDRKVDLHTPTRCFQVSLYVLMSKFDGKTGKEYQTYKESILKKFQLTGLPPYLILYNKVRLYLSMLI